MRTARKRLAARQRVPQLERRSGKTWWRVLADSGQRDKTLVGLRGFESINDALRLIAFLVGSHQLGLTECVPLNRFFDVRFLRVLEVREIGIECVELEEVPMPSDRRARTTVSGLSKIVG